MDRNEARALMAKLDAELPQGWFAALVVEAFVQDERDALAQDEDEGGNGVILGVDAPFSASALTRQNEEAELADAISEWTAGLAETVFSRLLEATP